MLNDSPGAIFGWSLKPGFQGREFCLSGVCQTTLDLRTPLQETCPSSVPSDKFPHDKLEERKI